MYTLLLNDNSATESGEMMIKLKKLWTNPMFINLNAAAICWIGKCQSTIYKFQGVGYV